MVKFRATVCSSSSKTELSPRCSKYSLHLGQNARDRVINLCHADGSTLHGCKQLYAHVAPTRHFLVETLVDGRGVSCALYSEMPSITLAITPPPAEGVEGEELPLFLVEEAEEEAEKPPPSDFALETALPE